MGLKVSKKNNIPNKKNWETLYEGFKSNPELIDVPLETQIEGQSELRNESVTYKAFQLSGKYIVTSFNNDVILIDQQRAHERILYEHFLNTKEQKGISTQKVLFPVHIELSTNDFVLMQNLDNEFKLLGFEIPKKIFLINDTFMNLGLTTATAKLKRHEIKKYF